MGRRASPALIGVFVLGAVALAVLGILSLGRGPLLGQTVRMVAIFRSSVAGLDVGAPVRFRGVPIGRVTSIHARWSEDAEDVLIPVVLQLEADGIQAPADPDHEARSSLESRAFVDRMIALGLRAELQYESFVTNKLFVDLEFHPETEAVFVREGELFELPTVQTGLVRLRQSIEQLPIDELVARALGAVTSLERLLASPEIEELIADLRAAAAATEGLARTSETELATLRGAAVEALTTTREVLVETGAQVAEAAAELGASADDLGDELAPLSREATSLFADLRGVAARLEEALALDPSVGPGIATLVAEVTATARAVRRLAEFLERNPESLLRGRRNP